MPLQEDRNTWRPASRVSPDQRAQQACASFSKRRAWSRGCVRGERHIGRTPKLHLTRDHPDSVSGARARDEKEANSRRSLLTTTKRQDHGTRYVHERKRHRRRTDSM